MNYDLVILGAGPAGMSAAATAGELGLKTLLLDEQPRPGGQIYRNVGIASSRMANILGPDYQAGTRLLERLHASGVEIRYDTLVWDVSEGLEIAALQNGQAFQVKTRQLIAATGAMERPSPLRGWTLPGVMNAGAAQIAMKSGGYVPSGRIALVGAGPLLLLVACQLIEAGAQLVAVVDTSPKGQWKSAIRHLPGALRSPEYLIKGLHLLRHLRSSGVSRYRDVSDLQILGTGRASGLQFKTAGKPQSLDVDTILLHHGVIPNHQLSRLLRVEHTWDATQLAWRVTCDNHGQTTLRGFRVAGDALAISGAIAAEASGALAALGAAYALGCISEAELRRYSSRHQRLLKRHQSIRPFLDALYRPPTYITYPPNDVVVCRCEEVTAGTIRDMAALGCRGPNQTKFFSRCGMGPCQGRICGTVVTQLLADATHTAPGHVGTYRIRGPLKPVRLSAIANIDTDAT